jgi:hypothetical protein
MQVISNINLIKILMMKNIYILIILSFFMLISCNQDEFLDKQPYDQIITENVITDFKSFETAAKGTYNFFQDGSYYNNSYVIISDLMSDNTQATSTVFVDIDKYETKADNGDVKRVWDKISATIAHTSIVIRKAEKFNFGVNQEAANKIIGQLYIARSLAYFDMQRIFAQAYNFTSDASHLGVPLLDEDKVGIEIISPARSTTAQVYAKIIKDLEKGISLVGDDTASVFYMNKLSAKALLARVYLYKENWAEAHRLATEVISSGKYTLVTNANYVAGWALASTSESIFSIKNTATDNAATSSLPYNYGFPRILATTDLYNSMVTGDVRKTLVSTARKVAKYPAFTTRDNSVPVIRLSEMYLIQAEALSEMGGTANEVKARTAVNTILLRSRPTATPYTETGDALKDVIQKERRKELMFEGHRLFDLTRKKKSFIKYSTSVSTPISITYPSNFVILPVPQSELDANININAEHQNPGY